LHELLGSSRKWTPGTRAQFVNLDKKAIKYIRSNTKLISKKLGYLILKSYQHSYNSENVTRSVIKTGKVRNFTFVEQKKNNSETVWVKKLLS
jgi:hypothetical protein